MMYLFWGTRWGAKIVMREGHIIGLQGTHAVHADVIYWGGGVLRNSKGLLNQASTWGEMICQMDGTETSDTFSLFLY